MDFTFNLTGGSISSGYTISRSDTSGISNSFDTLAFSLISNTVDNTVFSSLNVDYLAVPEPSAWALLLGAGGLLALGRYRQRMAGG
jgi:hypothetical protein